MAKGCGLKGRPWPRHMRQMDSRLSQFSYEDGLARSVSAPCLGLSTEGRFRESFKLPFCRLPREGPQPGGGRLRRVTSDPVLDQFRASSAALARPHTVPSWLSCTESEKQSEPELWEPRNWGPSEKQQQAKRGLLARRKKTQALRDRDQRRIQYMVDRRKDEREARLKRLVQAGLCT